MTNEITRPGFTPHYGGIPCTVRESRCPGYVDIQLKRDPGYGSMSQNGTAATNVEWRRDDEPAPKA